jgi:hypothetical protein
MTAAERHHVGVYHFAEAIVILLHNMMLCSKFKLIESNIFLVIFL